MHIATIRAYRQLQPFVEGTYATSGGSASEFDALIVAVSTDEGLTGWGEMAPLGAFYAPAFPAGARSGVAEVAPHLIGEDPMQPRRIVRRMDAVLRGHPYVKSALDMACWDIAAQRRGQPLCEALGGRFGDSVELYRPIPPGTSEAMGTRALRHIADGYRRLQIKVGGHPDLDAERLTTVRNEVGSGVVLFADANGGWTTAAARRFLQATHDVDFTLEQPCASIDECRALRAYCPHPVVLDESITSVDTLLRVARDRLADGVTLKIARLGGVTRTAALRDLAVDLGLCVTVEDTGGASIDTAAIVHLSLSTPQAQRLHTVDFRAWVTVDNADGLPTPSDGCLTAPTGEGLGVTVRVAELGDPIFVTP
jgi:cis-L-3-hydroxyproline dehydratase